MSNNSSITNFDAAAEGIPGSATEGSEMTSPSDTSGSSSRSPNTIPVPLAPSSAVPISPSRDAISVQPSSSNTSSLPNSPSGSAKADRDRPPTPTQAQQTPDGIVLGLEQLERQQEEAERRRREQTAHTTTPVRQQPQRAPQPPQEPQLPIPREIMQQFLEDDENTAPSSTLESSTNPRGDSSHVGDASTLSDDNTAKAPLTIGGIIKSTKVRVKRLSSKHGMVQRRRSRSNDMAEPVEEDEEGTVEALIYGHLQKLGRNGKWQTRWFETDGECLSYYKSSKRTKLLATLDLEKVGAIVVNDEDPKGCSFTIQVLGRPYYLRAESRASCKDWVITLNRVKEAHLQQGNVKLVAPTGMFGNTDLLGKNVSNYTPGVVAVANRQRTRAVDESGMESIEADLMMKENAVAAQQQSEYEGVEAYYQNEDMGGSLQQAVLARWQKRKSSMSQLASKLARWARSLNNKYNCSDVDDKDVRLDHRIHPPGHDDFRKRPASEAGKAQIRGSQPDTGMSDWIGKEASLAAKSAPQVPPPGIDPAVGDMPVQHVSHAAVTTNDDEPRELS